MEHLYHKEQGQKKYLELFILQNFCLKIQLSPTTTTTTATTTPPITSTTTITIVIPITVTITITCITAITTTANNTLPMDDFFVAICELVSVVVLIVNNLARVHVDFTMTFVNHTF